MPFLSLSGERQAQKNQREYIFKYLLMSGHFIFIILLKYHYKPIRDRDPTGCQTAVGTIHIEYNEKRACCNCAM